MTEIKRLLNFYPSHVLVKDTMFPVCDWQRWESNISKRETEIRATFEETVLRLYIAPDSVPEMHTSESDSNIFQPGNDFDLMFDSHFSQPNNLVYGWFKCYWSADIRQIKCFVIKKHWRNISVIGIKKKHLRELYRKWLAKSMKDCKGPWFNNSII